MIGFRFHLASHRERNYSCPLGNRQNPGPVSAERRCFGSFHRMAMCGHLGNDRSQQAFHCAEGRFQSRLTGSMKKSRFGVCWKGYMRRRGNCGVRFHLNCHQIPWQGLRLTRLSSRQAKRAPFHFGELAGFLCPCRNAVWCIGVGPGYLVGSGGADARCRRIGFVPAGRARVPRRADASFAGRVKARFSESWRR